MTPLVLIIAIVVIAVAIAIAQRVPTIFAYILYGVVVIVVVVLLFAVIQMLGGNVGFLNRRF